MKAVFCHDTYYSRAPDGSVYAHGAFPYGLWRERFLLHFEQITIIGREKAFEPADPSRLNLSSGPGVTFRLLPNINAPLKRLFSAGKVHDAITREIKASDALIVRGPVEFAMMAAHCARRLGKPYAVEMSGCAFDHTWYHGSLIGKLYAPLKYIRARKMVKNADFAIYVTKSFLQKRYQSNGRTENASNVEITMPAPEVLERRLKKIKSRKRQDKIVFGLIGNYGNNLKGLGVAIEALGAVRNQLPPFELRILGQGNPQKWLPQIQKNNLSKNIVFFGSVPGGDAVLQWLDEIDVYLQPSFHEGLPRALIEAMSRGCPALASDAGGTSELLPASLIHHRGNSTELYFQILVSTEPEWQMDQAKKNFEAAKNYTKEILVPRRKKFWLEFAEYARSKKSQVPG